MRTQTTTTWYTPEGAMPVKRIVTLTEGQPRKEREEPALGVKLALALSAEEAEMLDGLAINHTHDTMFTFNQQGRKREFRLPKGMGNQLANAITGLNRPLMMEVQVGDEGSVSDVLLHYAKKESDISDT